MGLHSGPCSRIHSLTDANTERQKQTNREQVLVSPGVSPGDPETVMDKTQHEYLAGKLKLQNTEKDRAGGRKKIKIFLKAPVGQMPTFNPLIALSAQRLFSPLLFKKAHFKLLWDMLALQ